jgi:hypothetical protein
MSDVTAAMSVGVAERMRPMLTSVAPPARSVQASHHQFAARWTGVPLQAAARTNMSKKPNKVKLPCWSVAKEAASSGSTITGRPRMSLALGAAAAWGPKRKTVEVPHHGDI